MRTQGLSRDGDLDLDTRLQADASLKKNILASTPSATQVTHNLLDDLARRVQVDEALVHLELVTVPGLRSLTTGLPTQQSVSERNTSGAGTGTYRLAGGDAQDLGREPHRALYAQLLVLGAVDQVCRD
jgi:hypothetical protein